MRLGMAMKEHGFEVVPNVLRRSEQHRLIDALGPVTGAGRRGLLSVPHVAQLASSARIFDLIRPHFLSEPRPVRAIYFNKCVDANWLVTWNQDLTVALQEQAPVPGFGPWSTKDGVPHVQPPVELLERMLAVRLHLDDCDETNGALRVLPGSHCLGRLSAERIQRFREENDNFLCCLRAGDALLMRPLLLHASSRSQSGCHRRVLHIEYADFSLPKGLRWYEPSAPFADHQRAPM